jgi:predicted nucleotidyltransferase
MPGVVRRERHGRASTFTAASDSPIYPELKSLLTKLLGLGPRIRQALSERTGIEHAFLYGSYASGNDSAESDVDLFVIGSLSGLELATALRPLTQGFHREINVTSYTRSEMEARLAAGDPFVTDVWAKPKTMLLGKEEDLPKPPSGE